MLPSLQLPVGALFTVTARIKCFVVADRTESCDILIVSGDETLNKHIYDTVKYVLKRNNINNTLGMRVQDVVLDKIRTYMNVTIDDHAAENAYDHIDDHLSVSIGGYVVSQLHVPGSSAEYMSSYASSLLSSVRLGDDVFFAGCMEVKEHGNGVYEF